MMNPGKLRNKVEVLTKEKLENALGEDEYKYTHSKYVYMQIIPKSSSAKQGEANTEKIESTHVFKCRLKSLLGLDNTYRFQYRGQVYDVEYFDPDFQNSEFYQIYVKLVIE